RRQDPRRPQGELVRRPFAIGCSLLASISPAGSQRPAAPYSLSKVLRPTRYAGRSILAKTNTPMSGITDPVADYLTRIRNAQQARHRHVDIPASKQKRALTQILLEKGFIRNYLNI